MQLYGEPDDAGDDVARRVLIGFTSVAVPADGTVQVDVAASLRPLQRWTGERLRRPATGVLVRAAFDAADDEGPMARIRLG